ncbi:hypothetical protein ACFY8Q_04140 [[Kitasatospora] papulosa]|uniref:DUF7683 domain-containing protein n=1 Tax=Streptomyces TaxID=1883 RepID=UPI0012FEFD26|nr:hypothetical protein [[Kitasatospora] papulosa]
MKFVIVSYKGESDEPDGEFDISEVGGDSLARILGRESGSLVDVYPINESQAEALGRLTGMTFDLSTHEYFLEALAD